MKAMKFWPMVEQVAKLSKDARTKVGALVVDDSGAIRAIGYNGQPRGCNDEDVSRQEYPAKGYFFAHAEENCIANAARVGVSLEGCTMLVTKQPCAACARMIINSGIKDIITVETEQGTHWFPSCLVAEVMFEEAGVNLSFVSEYCPA